jgi:FecR protein
MKATFAGKSRALLLMCLSGLLLFIAPKARADEGDPPSRVARISYLDGSVSFQPTGTEDWAAAAKNRPVTVGDKLWTDQDSRAELQAGQASLHLGSMTALSFLNLDENILQARVAEGAVNFRVRELREGDLYEIDTPNLAFTVKEAGAFRVDVNENGDGTRVTVIRGEGEITAGGQTYEVHAGEQAELNGVDNPEYHVGPAPAPDDLDHWANDRDLKEEHSESGKYVSRDVPGYSDLDDYGSWREEPDYGPVWYPREVEAGWAPYSYGYWNWVGPWGWTWVDYAPWGFAPFHYGRWAFVGGAWGWCPGPIYGRPFYGPAFVGFLGGGFGFGVGFGGGWGGGIGWFPLGFREPFHPWYHASGSYFRNVNITNTRITNINTLNNFNHNNFNYRYAHESRAVTAASRNAFVNGQAINRGAAHVSEASLRGARVTNGASFSPTKASFTGAANARGRVSTPPSSVVNRSVMARTAPNAAASHIPVHTMDTRTLSAGRVGNGAVNGGVNRGQNNANFGARNGAGTSASPNNRQSNNGAANNGATSARQRELANNRPPSASAGGGFGARSSVNGNASADRPSNSGTRNWSAQGNTTDRGRAPQGFGSASSSNRPGSNRPGVSSQAAGSAHTDRPPWAGSGNSRSSAPAYNGNRPSNSSPSTGSSRGYANNNRSYQPPARSSAPSRSYEAPSRSYSAPNRSYSPPARSYSAPSAPSRSYSAPSRSYSAPSRSYSAPSRSYGGGGGSHSYGGAGGSHGSSGGGSHGGGGSSHSGGGGSHGH